MSTVQEEIQKEMPAQPVGVLDVMNLPPGAAALTSSGRSYTKAAQHLHTLQMRRAQVLKDYQQKLQEMNPIMEELVRCHAGIDEIIRELSQKPQN